MNYRDTDNIVTQIMAAIRFHPNMVKNIIHFINKTLKEDNKQEMNGQNHEEWIAKWIATDPDGTVTEFEMQPEETICLADPDGYETSWIWMSKGRSRPCTGSLLSLAPAVGKKRKI